MSAFHFSVERSRRERRSFTRETEEKFSFNGLINGLRVERDTPLKRPLRFFRSIEKTWLSSKRRRFRFSRFISMTIVNSLFLRNRVLFLVNFCELKKQAETLDFLKYSLYEITTVSAERIIIKGGSEARVSKGSAPVTHSHVRLSNTCNAGPVPIG